MKIPFVGQAYKHRSLKLSAQTCINWYPEFNQDAKEVVSLINTPGMVEFADLQTNKPVTSMKRMDNYVYAVSDGKLFKVGDGGSVENLGSLNLGLGRLTMAHNGYQMSIANRVGGWVYNNTTDTLAEITDAAFPGAVSSAFFDGYVVYVNPDTGEFFICTLRDATEFDASDYATAEGAPDNLVACLNDHRELWLFGKTSTEIWYNSGDSGFPFDRMTGAFIEKGCAAAHSPAKVDNTVFWLGDDRVIYRAANYVPQRISTHPLEKEFESYNQVNDAFGYTYVQEGHSFYVLTFPTEGATWCYDASTRMWHQRKSYGIDRHRSNCYAYLEPYHLVGDYNNGKLYYLDLDTYTDAGGIIERERATQTMSNEGKKIFFSELEVEIETAPLKEPAYKLLSDVDITDGGTWYASAPGVTFPADGEVVLDGEDAATFIIASLALTGPGLTVGTKYLASFDINSHSYSSPTTPYADSERLSGLFIKGVEATRASIWVEPRLEVGHCKEAFEALTTSWFSLAVFPGTQVHVGSVSVHEIDPDFPVFDIDDDPRIMLQYSNDSGKTWSNERWATFGKTGEFKARSRWTRLGSGRDRAWRVRITDPVKAVLLGARAKATGGTK